jgi:Phytanoyl-CoA dioxygenase (PhyH)
MSSLSDPLTLERDGAASFPGVAAPALPQLADLFDHHRGLTAGARLFDCPKLRHLLAGSAVDALAAELIGPSARPVRALLLDKHHAANWGLGWHQDRVIAVRRCVDTAGFGPWSVKRGVPHVAPPWSVLAKLLTLRVHLDPVDDHNAPLLIVPGSHRAGIVSEPELDGMVERLGTQSCHAAPGDVWAYATPIIHASAPSRSAARRRVLQLDYAAFNLPDGLEWHGI